MEVLRRADCSVNEISREVRVTGTTLSFHLRVLATAGLIRQRRSGRMRTYALDHKMLRQVAEWLRSFTSPSSVAPSR
jgi:DNA-binding transcriptional ArsR family regulator